jgi:hypothetical protein
MGRRRIEKTLLKKIIQYRFSRKWRKCTKEPSDTHKKTLKEELLEEITEKFMEKILDMVNQNVQDVFKKFQDTKIAWEDKETNKWTQKGLHQTPKWKHVHYKKEVYELKMQHNVLKRNWTKIWKTSAKESNRNLGNKKSL